jgi:hypothetical protein
MIADALAADGVVEGSKDEEAAGHRVTRGQREAGGNTILLDLELRIPSRAERART